MALFGILLLVLFVSSALGDYMCPHCHDVHHADECQHVIQCKHEEVCFIHHDHDRFSAHCEKPDPNTGCHRHDQSCGSGPKFPHHPCTSCCTDQSCVQSYLNMLSSGHQHNPPQQPHSPFNCPMCHDASQSSQCSVNPAHVDKHHQCQHNDLCMIRHDHGRLTTECSPAHHCFDELNKNVPCGSGSLYPDGRCFTCCDNYACAEKAVLKLDTDSTLRHTCPHCSHAHSSAECQQNQTCAPGEVCMASYHDANGLAFSCEPQKHCEDRIAHTHSDRCSTLTTLHLCHECCHDYNCAKARLQQLDQLFNTMPSTTVSTTRAPKSATTAGTTSLAPLCPQCTNVGSYGDCVARQRTCAPGEMCEISVKNWLFSAKCATKTDCLHDIYNESLANCVHHAMYNPIDGCNRCCQDAQCTFDAMKALQQGLEQSMTSQVFCPHCSYERDHTVCLTNMAQCTGSSSQVCHLMHHEDGTFSAGCSNDLPTCAHFESLNPSSCGITGFSPASVCHFCCSTRTCVAKHTQQATPYTTLNPPTTTQPAAANTNTLPVNWCVDTETKCASYDTTFNLCSFNDTTAPTYQFIVRYCPKTCNKCAEYMATVLHITNPPTTHLSTSPAPVVANSTTKTVECYTCSGLKTCEYRHHPVTCAQPDHFCVNRLHNHADGTRTLEMGCGTETVCQNEWWLTSSLSSQCQRFDSRYVNYAQFDCTFCCTSDLCNNKPRPITSLYHV